MATTTTDEEQRAPKRRASWTGSIQLGLVNVPVKMYSATEDHRVRFHLVHDQDGARIRERHECTEDGARRRERTSDGSDVPFEHIARGYDLGGGKTVIVSPGELDSLAPESTKILEIEEFVAPQDLDPMVFDQSYWLAPDRGGEKAYALLVAAIERTGRVGIGTFVMRRRQHLAALRSAQSALALATLHYADEIVSASAIAGLPGPTSRPHARELELAERLIRTRATPFRPERWRDETRERILAYLAQKAAGGAALPVPARERRPEPLGLIEALRGSLAAPQRVPASPPANEPAPPARAPARRRSGRRAA